MHALPSSLRWFPLVAAFTVAACSGSQPPGSDESPELIDVWGGYDAAFTDRSEQDIPCSETYGTWFEDFGARGVACVASGVVEPNAFVARSGVEAFRSGPHRADGQVVRLDLNNTTSSFGQYNPEFVSWVVENAVVGEGRPEIRMLTQPVYDRHFQRIARVYWVTYADMAADGFPRSVPAGILSDYADYLDLGRIPDGAEGYEGGFSVFAFTELSEGVVGRLGPGMADSWSAKYEGNTAFGFWIRRRADGTVGQWHEGLRRLLATYDADWLRSQS